MEVTDSSEHRTRSTPEAGERRRRAPDRPIPRFPDRPILRVLAACSVVLVVLSATVSAHGDGGHGGAGVAFAIVLGLPIVAGLVGGVAAVRYRTAFGGSERRRTSSLVFGVFLVGLGVTFVFTALTMAVGLSVVAGAIGILTALSIGLHNGTLGGGCRGHADLTFGGLFAHRLLEGVLLGALYSTGAALGALGAVVLAGHTTVETAAVGGLYAPQPLRALAAIGLVQAGYAVGATVGVGAGGTVPASIQVLSLAFVGGSLLVVGGIESGHVLRSRRRPVSPESVLVDRDDRGGSR